MTFEQFHQVKIGDLCEINTNKIVFDFGEKYRDNFGGGNNLWFVVGGNSTRGFELENDVKQTRYLNECSFKYWNSIEIVDLV